MGGSWGKNSPTHPEEHPPERDFLFSGEGACAPFFNILGSGLQPAIRPATLHAMDDRIAEDARFALLAKVRQPRMMSARAKLLAGAELFEEACAWNLAGIAAEHPGASESEKRKELQRRIKLADRLNR